MQLNYLHRAESWQVLWFHDSFEILERVDECIDRNTFVIFSFSWFSSRDRLENIFLAHSQLLAASMRGYLRAENMLYLFNSKEEFVTASELNNCRFNLAHVNNASLIDVATFRYEHDVAKSFLAVYNAKPLAFKRHFLSRLVQPKMFISYDVNEVDYGITSAVDIESFAPELIVRNITQSEVAECLNQCNIGLMLSEEEGACYASLEYLLCGLPVVSTLSRGGRDEFYDQNNSLIVAPSEADVLDAVHHIISHLQSGALQPAMIRQKALFKVLEFRANFKVALERLLRPIGPEADELTSSIVQRIQQYPKMLDYRNFFHV